MEKLFSYKTYDSKVGLDDYLELYKLNFDGIEYYMLIYRDEDMQEILDKRDRNITIMGTGYSASWAFRNAIEKSWNMQQLDIIKAEKEYHTLHPEDFKDYGEEEFYNYSLKIYDNIYGYLSSLESH